MLPSVPCAQTSIAAKVKTSLLTWVHNICTHTIHGSITFTGTTGTLKEESSHTTSGLQQISLIDPSGIFLLSPPSPSLFQNNRHISVFVFYETVVFLPGDHEMSLVILKLYRGFSKHKNHFLLKGILVPNIYPIALAEMMFVSTVLIKELNNKASKQGKEVS